MAICKTCGRTYSKFTTPVSAHGVCRDCFFKELAEGEDVAPADGQLAQAGGKEAQMWPSSPWSIYRRCFAAVLHRSGVCVCVRHEQYLQSQRLVGISISGSPVLADRDMWSHLGFSRSVYFPRDARTSPRVFARFGRIFEPCLGGFLSHQAMTHRPNQSLQLTADRSVTTLKFYERVLNDCKARSRQR